jgi:hypothetical protein
VPSGFAEAATPPLCQRDGGLRDVAQESQIPLAKAATPTELCKCDHLIASVRVRSIRARLQALHSLRSALTCMFGAFCWVLQSW